MIPPYHVSMDPHKTMCAEQIRNSSRRPGDLVADVFAGSGTTGVAALRHGRRYLLVDDNPEAVRIAERRVDEERRALARTRGGHGEASSGMAT